MKKVIFIEQPKEETKKPVEFKFAYGLGGQKISPISTGEFIKIVYLGNCHAEGDMFACYRENESIVICVGHLNSGEY